jgi:hypothetical protein
MLKIRQCTVYSPLILLATLLLISCGRTNLLQEASPLPSSGTATSSSVASSPIATDAPNSSVTSPQPTPAATPDGDSVVIQGVLTLMDPTTFAPEEDGLYLVPVEADEESVMAMPSVNPETSIRARIDETDGSFQFTDIPTGVYAVKVVSEDGLELSVRRLESGETAIISVEKEELGQTIDLGRLRVP